MGASWDETEASKTLFKVMLKKALPEEVQDQLETVVGLNTMPWPTFEANVIHFVERHRKKEKEARKTAEDLLIQLHKAQLNELARNKQENQEKRKKEATESAAKQAALLVAPAPAPQAQSPQAPTTQQAVPAPATITQPQMVYQQPAATMVPAAYPIVPQYQMVPQYQPQMRGWGPPRGRGRGAMNQRYGSRNQWSGPNRQQEGCWNCGEAGHIRVDCPNWHGGKQQAAPQRGMGRMQNSGPGPQDGQGWTGQWMGPAHGPVPPGGSPWGPAPGGQ